MGKLKQGYNIFFHGFHDEYIISLNKKFRDIALERFKRIFVKKFMKKWKSIVSKKLIDNNDRK